jgi:hypothetical protein
MGPATSAGAWRHDRSQVAGAVAENLAPQSIRYRYADTGDRGWIIAEEGSRAVAVVTASDRRGLDLDG